MRITGQMIVKNEDRFVRFAIMSVLPYLSKMLIYDTGSSDKTREIIEAIKSPKIIFEEKGAVTPAELVTLRKEQLERTNTEFFMLVDGDEIWPKHSMKKLTESLVRLPEKKLAVICRTRNAVGDVWHYLPEEAGAYQFLGRRGNFNMRVLREVSGLAVEGIYPLEEYTFQGESLNSQDDRLEFIDVWYLHATHLRRSSNEEKVMGFRKKIIDRGLVMAADELPEALSGEVLAKRSLGYEAVAGIIGPLKALGRQIK